MNSGGMTRRGALAGAAGLGLAGCASVRPHPPLPAPRGVFRHGIASGDPEQTSVMLWTALSGAGRTARAEIAADPGFADIVWSGQARAREGDGGVDGAVPVKALADGLPAGRALHYRFTAGGETSPAGGTRTLPDGRADRFVIAAFSCANHAFGFFNAYRDAAERGGADLVVHLGDYIYEYAHGVRSSRDAEALSRVHDPRHETVTQADYARRHAQYCLDPDLQAAKAMAPWIVTWDDHESANNAARDSADGHDPASQGPWEARRRAAARAFHDWLPTREPADKTARWGEARIGDLATLVFLETRLTARGEPIGLDDFPVSLDADPEDPDVQAVIREWAGRVLEDPSRQLLGPEQLDFVEAALARSAAAGQPWRVLANQVLMAPVMAPDFMATTPWWLRLGARLTGGLAWDYARLSAFGTPLTVDGWDGFPAERARLFKAMRRAGADVITLTGDTHNSWVIDLADADGTRLGTEFGVTAVCAPSEFETIPAPGVDFGALVEARNPRVLRHNAYDKGWLRLTLTPGEALAELITVSTVKSRDFTPGVDGAWRITRGDGVARQAEQVS